MVNGYCKLFLLCRRIDSIFDFALKTHASRAGSFCCSGGPQILSFFIDATKVHLFHCGSRILRQIFFFCAVKTVKVKMVKIENGCCQNRHYNINILFIYSEQMTAFPKSILTKMTMTTLTTLLRQGCKNCPTVTQFTLCS